MPEMDAYANVQRRLREIHKAFPDNWEPLDLHVLAVKPKWLCRTFGFHPMLGFRREKQARSIAHGCASTLAALARIESDPTQKTWAQAWGVRPIEFHDDPENLTPRKAALGTCWFRKGENHPCPFSRETTSGRPEIREREIAELDRIYTLCGEPATHRA